jgi:hypothetical protein
MSESPERNCNPRPVSLGIFKIPPVKCTKSAVLVALKDHGGQDTSDGLDSSTGNEEKSSSDTSDDELGPSDQSGEELEEVRAPSKLSVIPKKRKQKTVECKHKCKSCMTSKASSS